MNTTMRKLIKGVRAKRAIHLEKWIKKHLDMISINKDKPKDLRDLPDINQLNIPEFEELLKRKFGLEYTIQSVNAYNDTEEHRIYIHGKQIGTTLFIKHDVISERKIKLIIHEEPTPIFDGEDSK
ncbi:MAG: hypothetical protein KAU06_04810 [Candidatus Marinimicrobia bacterium]|nr:hypothetical protein [Candidatus Neomarinimicrobiota bacterium]